MAPLTTMDNLPCEVLSEEIFIRLLAKQLAQMRCVSKSWNALLSESCFIKFHLYRAIHSNDEILWFFRQGYCSSIEACPSRSSDSAPTNFIKFPVKPQRGCTFGTIIGSVNGLICLAYISHDDYHVHIWNPSLSAVVTLPPCSLPTLGLNDRFRFGFDPKTDNYKVVKFTMDRSGDYEWQQVEVYSMKKHSLKVIIERVPSHVTSLYERDKMCLDGHLHWLACIDAEYQAILAFDLGVETFTVIPLPDILVDITLGRRTVLGVLAGKLCVVSCATDHDCEVWYMAEYGVAASWAKHHVLSQFSNITPFGFTLHNEFLFQTHNKCLALYDPLSAKVKLFKSMPQHLDIYKIGGYVDSLVLVAPTKNVSAVSVNVQKRDKRHIR